MVWKVFAPTVHGPAGARFARDPRYVRLPLTVQTRTGAKHLIGNS